MAHTVVQIAPRHKRDSPPTRRRDECRCCAVRYTNVTNPGPVGQLASGDLVFLNGGVSLIQQDAAVRMDTDSHEILSYSLGMSTTWKAAGGCSCTGRCEWLSHEARTLCVTVVRAVSPSPGRAERARAEGDRAQRPPPRRQNGPARARLRRLRWEGRPVAVLSPLASTRAGAHRSSERPPGRDADSSVRPSSRPWHAPVAATWGLTADPLPTRIHPFGWHCSARVCCVFFAQMRVVTDSDGTEKVLTERDTWMESPFGSTGIQVDGQLLVPDLLHG